MGYRIQIENGNCLNCGVCMDVCPVQALDMSVNRVQRNAKLPSDAEIGFVIKDSACDLKFPPGELEAARDFFPGILGQHRGTRLALRPIRP